MYSITPLITKYKLNLGQMNVLCTTTLQVYKKQTTNRQMTHNRKIFRNLK